MPELTVDLGERAYTIRIESGSLARGPESLLGLAADRQVAIVTNDVVQPLYGRALAARLSPHVHQLVEIVLPDGEANKTLTTLNRVFDALLAARFDRRCLLIALGGGVIGDMAGLAAALYQRGVDFVQVPTTLLAQVDSSVGGKTAVNHPAGKNMIGAFYQPKEVIIDVDVLQTLPRRELSAGLAEMIKHGAIADETYLRALERDMPDLLHAEPAAMIAAVAGSCRIKAEVVASDEKEAGRRAILNFGHTFGHAIEAGLGYGQWLHGEAVGAGMIMGAELSVRDGRLEPDFRVRLEQVCATAGLPLRGPAWPAERYLDLMAVDKKSVQGVPRFVVLDAPGAASLQSVDRDKVVATLATLGTAALAD